MAGHTLAAMLNAAAQLSLARAGVGNGEFMKP
jgi:hypothetical protein